MLFPYSGNSQSRLTFTMNPRLLLVAILALLTNPLSLEASSKPISNITVLGVVFCDACSNNTFSKHSYFLQGARVLIQCKFKANSTSTEEVSIVAERTTDRYGIYKLDIPPVTGFECEAGREIESMCRASLIQSSSSQCNVPGLRSSTADVARKSRKADVCFFNLNKLNYRPAKTNDAFCGTK